MAGKKRLVPEANDHIDRFKKETAAEIGVPLDQDYKGEISSQQAGSKGGKIGGQMVKKMIEDYESKLK